ncbi:hypothetical protein RHMOL_Rhmol03G0126500 [Rhododendron molle]|uniref:Uncharacterized protein n=1 Tax=Rhododendron molle TaxID=49168 RepID=A0ACC0PD92_RHOML|nr:hypothetical protein RHMOL_Rhmol03G0126500 [Rhododendron molle]
MLSLSPVTPSSIDSAPKSTEEIDHLERSTKKIKSDPRESCNSVEACPMESENEDIHSELARVSQPEDSPMEQQRESHAAIKELPKPIEKGRSFKATLLNEYTSTENFESSREEFEDLSEDEDMDIQDPPKTKSRIKAPVAAPELTVTKPISFNGNTVPEVSEDLGYGEWMVVSRRKERKNGPVNNGPRRVQAQKGKSVAQSVNMINGKTNPNSGQQYRPRGQPDNGAGPSRQPTFQQAQPKDTGTNLRSRPNETRFKPSNKASAKDNPLGGHRYEDNPLLRKLKNPTKANPVAEAGGKAQSDILSNRPIFSPISNMEVILDIPNPTPASNKQPPLPESSAPTLLEKPPDIMTYHEFARASECNRELSQGEHGDRFRHRSRSPSKSGLVARGTEVQNQTLGPSNVEVSQSHGFPEAIGAARASETEDPQTPRLV